MAFFFFLTMNHNIQREHDLTDKIHIIENFFENDFTVQKKKKKEASDPFSGCMLIIQITSETETSPAHSKEDPSS